MSFKIPKDIQTKIKVFLIFLLVVTSANYFYQARYVAKIYSINIVLKDNFNFFKNYGLMNFEKWVTTNSKELYDKLCLLRSHGITKMNMSENHGGWFYEMQELGYNYRLTDIQSALGITQLLKNNEGVAQRNIIAKRYKDSLQGIVKYQTLTKGSYNAHHLFVVEVENRDELYNKLREKEIYAQIHYIPVHTLPYYENIGYDDANLKHAENYYSKCISLPMYPTLKKDEQDYVIENIKEICKK